MSRCKTDGMAFYSKGISRSSATGVVYGVRLFPRLALNFWNLADERWRPDSDQVWVFPSRQHGKPIAEPWNILETLREEPACGSRPMTCAGPWPPRSEWRRR